MPTKDCWRRTLLTPIDTVGRRTCIPPMGRSTCPPSATATGLRRLAAIEASRGSFEEASVAVRRSSGTHVAKRQVEALARAAATDVEEFYAARAAPQAEPADVLVISADGKGIVMRPDALRPATARAAAEATPKLKARLSKGELCGIPHNSPYGSAGIMGNARSRSSVVPGQGGCS